MTSLHCLTLLGARDCPLERSLSKEAVERRGAKEGMEARREVVEAKNLPETTEEGVGEKLNRVFPGFSPGKYVSGTSPVRHDITRSPTFCVLSTFSNSFFRVFSGF